MNPASLDDLAIRSAVLPFVVSWKEIDNDAEVLSLDADQLGWDVLLAGQGIKLRTDIETGTDQWSVITKLGACDAISLNDLGAWASETLQSLKPGGFLIVGGTLPGQTELKFDPPYPEAIARILRNAGFARAHVILSSLDPGSKTLHAALYETSRKFAVIAQKHAVGKSFDVFSPSFLQLSTLSPETRFKRAEKELHARIHAGDAKLHDRITHIDTILAQSTTALEDTLNQHVGKSQVILDRQADEISHLRTEVESLRAALKRATRRRGLRKLAYEIRKKLHPKTQTATPPETERQVSPPQRPETVVREIQPTPDPTRPKATTTLAPVDPVPLSPHEVALRHRLFEEQDT